MYLIYKNNVYNIMYIVYNTIYILYIIQYNIYIILCTKCIECTAIS